MKASTFDERAYREQHAHTLARMTPTQVRRIIEMRRHQHDAAEGLTPEQIAAAGQRARRAARSWVKFAGAGIGGTR